MGDIGQRRTCKELKVENWAPYFMQRLNNLYTNNKHCDVTLQFASSQTLRVHRLVLAACSDYFEEIIDSKEFGNQSILQLGENMSQEVMMLIIGFMYTGKIEIENEFRDKIYNAAMLLKMPILKRLIESHFRQEEESHLPPMNTNVIDPLVVPVKKSQDNQSPPAAIFNKTAIASIPQPPALRVAPSIEKRLPIWKKPTQKTVVDSSFVRMDDRIRIAYSKSRPTRLEWDDQLDDQFSQPIVGDALLYLSHDNNLALSQPMFLGDYGSCTDDSEQNSASPSPPKKPRREGADLKEFGRQQQIRNQINMEAEDEEDVDDPPAPASPSPQPTPKPILKQVSRNESTDSPKRVRFSEAINKPAPPSLQPAHSPLPLATPLSKTTPATITPTPIIPTVNIDQRLPMTFVGAEKKITEAGTGELIVSRFAQQGEALSRIRYSVLDSDGNVTDDQPVDNPAKIVSEVLKKYPDLVTGKRKSIKLKVMGLGSNDPNSPAAKKVSYIVVKGAGMVAESPDEWDPENPGPWRCTPCGVPGSPMKFLQYEDFRNHIVNVHDVQVDSRICKHCGWKLPKKNHHQWYHMYTKHGIAPPPPIVFPSCKFCSHVSMSESLLQKHMDFIHKFQGKDVLSCTPCNVTFKSHLMYSHHLHSDWHRKRTATQYGDYPCPFCDQDCLHADELKEHIESEHQKPGTLLSHDSKAEITIDESSQPSLDNSVNENSNLDGDDSKVYLQDTVVEQDGDEHPDNDSVVEMKPDITSCNDNNSQTEEESASNQGEVSFSEVNFTQEYCTTAEEPNSESVDESQSDYNKQTESQTDSDVTLVEEQENDSMQTMEYETTADVSALPAENSENYETVGDVQSFNAAESTENYQPENEVSFTTEENEETSQIVYDVEEEATSGENLYRNNELQEVYETQENGAQQMVYHVEDNSMAYRPQDSGEVEVYDGDCPKAQESSYGSLVVDEGVPSSDVTSEPEDGNTEVDTEGEMTEEVESSEDRVGRGDHDYSPYNSVVMFPPSNIVLPQRVMLVTHPLQVLLSGPNIIPDQIVSIPYPQCGPVQMVNSGQVVVTTAGPVATTTTDCTQVVRERKVVPESLVNEWDENSQTDAAISIPTTMPGEGPSRPDFF